MPKEFTPIFVGGTGRSGTTIILNILKNHENFHSSMPREIRYLTDRKGLIDLNFSRSMFEQFTLKEFRDEAASRLLPILGKSNLEMFLSRSKGRWWSETGKKGKLRGLTQAIDRQTFEDALDTFTAQYRDKKLEASRELFYRLSSAQFKKPNVQFFGDSTPPNIMNADFLHRLFPEAKFVNMVRDGRDVAHSVSLERWGPSDPYKALDWWMHRIIKGEKALKEVPSGDQMTLRLENLIQRDRAASFDKLLAFIGLHNSIQLQAYFESDFTVEKMHHGKWREAIPDSRAYNKKYDLILSKLADKGIVVEKFY